ncbi:MAG: glycosyltransferase family 87 protein [Ardenticatenia bacterium]|nr:glycosyltransferase family 87 protein [Ardenticatenia bacterium]
MVISTLVGLMVLLMGLPVTHSDFYDFYLAARALLAGENVYAPQPNGLQGFFNPLWATFPVAPLVPLSPAVAFNLWRFTLAIAQGTMVYVITRLRGEYPTPGWLALVGWLLLIPWFVGQNSPLVAVGVFLALLWGARGRWLWAGATMPLLAIKPHTVPFFSLLILWRGRRQAIVGAVISLTAVTLIGWVLQPWWILTWLGSRWADSQQGGGQSWMSAGLPNVLAMVGLPPWFAVLGMFVGLWTIWHWQKAEWYTLAALALTVGTATTIYMRPLDFSLLLPGLLVLPSKSRYRVAAVLALIFFGLPSGGPLFWLIPAVASGALIWYLVTSPPTQPDNP